MRRIDRLMEDYMDAMNNPHDPINQISLLDLTLRDTIGRTEDLRSSKCSHASIIQRELSEGGYPRCRQCGIELTVGVGHWNDYLVFRNKDCSSPICRDCAKNRPDLFHIEFQKALTKIKVTGEYRDKLAALFERSEQNK